MIKENKLDSKSFFLPIHHSNYKLLSYYTKSNSISGIKTKPLIFFLNFDKLPSFLVFFSYTNGLPFTSHNVDITDCFLPNFCQYKCIYCHFTRFGYIFIKLHVYFHQMTCVVSIYLKLSLCTLLSCSFNDLFSFKMYFYLKIMSKAMPCFGFVWII